MQRERLSTSLTILTETDPQDIQLLRQAARNAFMESVKRQGFDVAQFVASADKWWEGTV